MKCFLTSPVKLQVFHAKFQFCSSFSAFSLAVFTILQFGSVRAMRAGPSPRSIGYFKRSGQGVLVLCDIWPIFIFQSKRGVLRKWDSKACDFPVDAHDLRGLLNFSRYLVSGIDVVSGAVNLVYVLSSNGLWACIHAWCHISVRNRYTW